MNSKPALCKKKACLLLAPLLALYACGGTEPQNPQIRAIARECSTDVRQGVQCCRDMPRGATLAERVELERSFPLECTPIAPQGGTAQ